MKITIEYDDGALAIITAEEFIEACLRTLTQMRANRSAEPGRCQLCSYGRVGDGYCTCLLGRDLKRIETRMPNPVGGMDDDGAVQ